ncbi:hypothetical protein [Streptomyces achromogenes]|uniref:hypothetical protein n=1 Tax=Streptomyces achromogenes TaxID=67255 RepID=UPI00367588A2
MSSSRHFIAPKSDKQLKEEIKADIAAARKAEQQLKGAGQYAMADRLKGDVNELLDELNEANNGTWKPRHA